MIDLDLLAMAWLCSWPFRGGRAGSAERRTQLALTALLDGGFAGMARVLGLAGAGAVVERAASGGPFRPNTYERHRPLRMDEQAEWIRLSRGEDRERFQPWLLVGIYDESDDLGEAWMVLGGAL